MAGTGTLVVTPDGTGTTVNTLPPSGQATPANSLPFVLDTTVETAPGTPGTGALTVQGNAGGVPLPVAGVSNLGYSTVAASASAQVLGTTGAVGDYLAELLVVPATVSPGSISITDGSGSAIIVFTGGSSSVSNLVPFGIPLGVRSKSGAWKITTGANLSVVATGNFT